MSESTTMIATNPAEMVTAQTGLIDWCKGKLSECMSELTQAHGIVEALRKANMSDASGRRVVTSVRKRITFYEKVQAALEAGYYILPPFPIQAFAIRVKDTKEPDTDYGKQNYPLTQNPDTLPIGEGHYVDPSPKRVYEDTQEEKDYNGAMVKKDYFVNGPWKDVAFPVAVVRPELIEATGKALEHRIFDLLGIFQRQKDPMIVGQIKHYKQFKEPLTFFVAWWVDTADL